MATFAKDTFSHSAYAKLRPSYPRSLYTTILTYHHGPQHLCLDLGCGPGIVTRQLAGDFTTVIGADPSPGMVEQARDLTATSSFPNLSFRSATAETLSFIGDGPADLVVAGQAAHWFDYARLWPELGRVLRPGGTVAFWGYADPVFVDYPRATEIIRRWASAMEPDKLGPYWTQPGRSIVVGLYRAIEPSDDFFEDVMHVEYVPGTRGPGSGAGEAWLRRKASIGAWKEFMRTWSAWHGWQEAHPGLKKRSDGGAGDVMDRLFDEIAAAEGWAGDEVSVEVEWGTGLVMGRRR